MLRIPVHNYIPLTRYIYGNLSLHEMKPVCVNKELSQDEKIAWYASHIWVPYFLFEVLPDISKKKCHPNE